MATAMPRLQTLPPEPHLQQQQQQKSNWRSGRILEFQRTSRGVYILSNEASKIDNSQFSKPSSEYLR
ncbi:hypothetical protein EYC80_004446 [Monilinia laxa]|uniref:Uncharacterized protein n=1 Tax=Monilinia laxa TaxID=61186 RepID=A0A5N6KMT0_MONLA|nr:hypothetical protein EYC80_004446 [Monilinia laxa]